MTCFNNNNFRIVINLEYAPYSVAVLQDSKPEASGICILGHPASTKKFVCVVFNLNQSISFVQVNIVAWKRPEHDNRAS
jgi:hypothetical protein